MAELQGAALLRQAESDGECKFLELHTTAYGVQYLSAVAAVLAAAGAEHKANTKLLFMSDRNGLQDKTGTFLIAGPAGLVKEWGPKLAAAMEGRGGGKKGYQGKAARADKQPEASRLLQEQL